MVVFGCADGTIHQYQFERSLREADNLTKIKVYNDLSGIVHSMVYDQRESRIAVTSGQSLYMWTVNTDCEFSHLHHIM